MMVVKLLDYYIDLVRQIKRGNYRGRVYNAKPIFLLFVLDQIEKKVIKSNHILFSTLISTDSYERFTKQYSSKPTPIQYPFYYLQTEPFWHFIWKYGEEIKTDIPPSTKFIRDNIDYAYLDNALWDLLQDAENRKRIKDSIIDYFFSSKNNESQNSNGNDNSKNLATNRQLWALRCATGIDYRGKGLTKQQVSKMIQEANEKSGYHKKGWLNEDEYKSKKQSANKKAENPCTSITPGSLEDILSKCKTREEQLEAARKYFGEDK